MGGIIDDVTPWNDESGLGKLATGVAVGVASFYTAGAAGVGFYGSMAAGGLAAAGYQQSASAKRQREEAKSRMENAAESRRAESKEDERRRRAAIRREMLASQSISGATRANPTDTSFEKREYKNKVPSLGNTINMSGE